MIRDQGQWAPGSWLWLLRLASSGRFDATSLSREIRPFAHFQHSTSVLRRALGVPRGDRMPLSTIEATYFMGDERIDVRFYATKQKCLFVLRRTLI